MSERRGGASPPPQVREYCAAGGDASGGDGGYPHDHREISHRFSLRPCPANRPRKVPLPLPAPSGEARDAGGGAYV